MKNFSFWNCRRRAPLAVVNDKANEEEGRTVEEEAKTTTGVAKTTAVEAKTTSGVAKTTSGEAQTTEERQHLPDCPFCRKDFR